MSKKPSSLQTAFLVVLPLPTCPNCGDYIVMEMRFGEKPADHCIALVLHKCRYIVTQSLRALWRLS